MRVTNVATQFEFFSRDVDVRFEQAWIPRKMCWATLYAMKMSSPESIHILHQIKWPKRYASVARLGKIGYSNVFGQTASVRIKAEFSQFEIMAQQKEISRPPGRLKNWSTLRTSQINFLECKRQFFLLKFF